MEVQAALGAEIAMAFDECAPGEATMEEARRSMELTLRWAKRSKEAFEVIAGKDAGEPQAGMPALHHRRRLFYVVSLR